MGITQSNQRKDNHHGADNIYVRAEQLLKYDDYPIWLKRDDTGTNNGRVHSEHHEEIIKETVLQNFNSDRFESGHYDVINEDDVADEYEKREEEKNDQGTDLFRGSMFEANENEGSSNTAALNRRPKLPLPWSKCRATITSTDSKMALLGENIASELGPETSVSSAIQLHCDNYYDDIYEPYEEASLQDTLILPPRVPLIQHSPATSVFENERRHMDSADTLKYELPPPPVPPRRKPPPVPPRGEKKNWPIEATLPNHRMTLYGEERANELGPETSFSSAIQLYDDELCDDIYEPPEATLPNHRMTLFGEERANDLGPDTSFSSAIQLYDDELCDDIYEPPEITSTDPKMSLFGENGAIELGPETSSDNETCDDIYLPVETDNVSTNEQNAPHTPAIEDRLEMFRETIINKVMIRQVLPHLHSIINPADVETIRKRSETKNYQNAAELALFHLSKSDKPDKWQLFLKALEASGHKTLTQLLKGEDVDLQDDDYGYGFIRLFAPTIRTAIRPLDLLPHLVASDVITQEDADEIRTKQNIKGETAAADLLLDRVHRKHPDWYNQFMNACEKSNLSEFVDICKTERQNFEINEATRIVKQERQTCTKHKVPKPVKMPKADLMSHIRYGRPSKLTDCVSANSKSTLARINVTEDNDICLKNIAKQLHNDNNYLSERLKKVLELTKTCDQNMELISQYKRALETLKNKQETIKKIHTEISYNFEVTSAMRSSGNIVSTANDQGFYES